MKSLETIEEEYVLFARYQVEGYKLFRQGNVFLKILEPEQFKFYEQQELKDLEPEEVQNTIPLFMFGVIPDRTSMYSVWPDDIQGDYKEGLKIQLNKILKSGLSQSEENFIDDFLYIFDAENAWPEWFKEKGVKNLKPNSFPNVLDMLRFFSMSVFRIGGGS